MERSSVIPTSEVEHCNPSNLQKEDSFMSNILASKNMETLLSEPIFDPCEITDEVMDDFTAVEADNYTPEPCDEYLSAKAMLPIGDSLLKGEVVCQVRDYTGCPIGNIMQILFSIQANMRFFSWWVNSRISG